METKLPDLLDNSISRLRRGDRIRNRAWNAGSRFQELRSLLATVDLVLKTALPRIPSYRIAQGRRRLEELAKERDRGRIRQEAIAKATKALAKLEKGPGRLRRALMAMLSAIGLPHTGRKASPLRLSLLFLILLVGTAGYLGVQSLERAGIEQTWVSVELVVNPPTPTATATPTGAGAIVGQVFVLPSPTPRTTPIPTRQADPTPTASAAELPVWRSTSPDVARTRSPLPARGITVLPD